MMVEVKKRIIKLQDYGINSNALKWIENYLQNRYQRVCRNGEKSTILKNDLGIPQGSILGALLFIIYLNDITEIIKNCNIHLFADDTLVDIAGKDIRTIGRKSMALAT